MSSKGGSNKNKRIALPVSRQVLRKAFTWAIRPSPGPHNQNTAIPLGEVVRDKLGLAQNRKEVKAVLNSGNVKVDEVVRKDPQFPVGLFDVVRIEEEKKQFRLVFDQKGRLQLREVDNKEKNTKICKITQKKVIDVATMQLTTNDGRTFIEKNSKTKIGDSFVIELPSQKIVRRLLMEEGNTVYLISGIRIGSTATLKQVFPGTMRKKALATLETENETFQTPVSNIMVVGEKTPEFGVTWKAAGEEQ